MRTAFSVSTMLILSLTSGFGGQAARADRPYSLNSPNDAISVQLLLPPAGSSETPSWSASFHGKPIFNHCRLSLVPADSGDLLSGASVRGDRRRSSDRRVKVLFGKTDFANDRFHEMLLNLESGKGRKISVVFRCYDDAIAFRYEIPKQKGLDRISISDESTSFGLAGNPLAYVQYLENYQTSHEHTVTPAKVSEIKQDILLDMPATFAWEDGTHVAITEAALRHYAGMSLMRSSSARNKSELECRLTPRRDGTKVVRHLPMETPWRVAIIGERAAALLESNVIYCLNAPCAIGNTSWIKPGKMTWSWWNGNVVKDGKAEPPIFTMEAQKTYIDFCAANGIPFHSTIADNTDTPWYKQSTQGIAPGPDTDVTQLRPDLDLAGIRRYAEAKGVRLWTWVHQAALSGKVEVAFAAFERFGWSGMMIDFFDHDDQESVELAEEILQAAARRHILIHYHGIWKSTGMQRTYPNLMNHEGALNLEYLKWSNLCTPDHTLNLLFTRMVGGPMDYHLGGFRAVTRAAFKPNYVAPNVLGTRCHQLACYVCMDNPNPMVADYPGAYEGQPGLDFLQIVPTWWDETHVLLGEIGTVIVTARRKGRDWYIGGMVAGKPREVQVPLSFIPRGRWNAKIWKDTPESESDPNRLAVESVNVDSSSSITVRMATDGGFTAILRSLGSR